MIFLSAYRCVHQAHFRPPSVDPCQMLSLLMFLLLDSKENRWDIFMTSNGRWCLLPIRSGPRYVCYDVPLPLLGNGTSYRYRITARRPALPSTCDPPFNLTCTPKHLVSHCYKLELKQIWPAESGSNFLLGLYSSYPSASLKVCHGGFSLNAAVRADGRISTNHID